MNNELTIKIEMLQDGTAVLDSKAVCTCNGGGPTCSSSCAGEIEN